MIKHVSFDVWGTLISANPQYAAARTALLSAEFDIDQATVKRVYTDTKRFVDNMAVESGGALSTRGCFDLLYENFGVGLSGHTLQLEHKLVQLFLEHAPTIMDQTKHQVAVLRDKGITLSIGSNSNFVPGDVMYPFLQEQFGGAFSFGVFSDQILVAKPTWLFFDAVALKMYQTYNSNWGDTPLNSEVLHVGDNYVCDGVGAKYYGFKYVILNDVADIQPAFRHLACLFNQ